MNTAPAPSTIRDAGSSVGIRALDVVAWVPYLALSVIHVLALSVVSPLAGPTKLALMPLLAIPVLLAAPRLRSLLLLALLIGAIAFSWLGDGAGAFFPDGPELPLMLLFFGIAHIGYITVFQRFARVRRLPWWTLVYVAWWVGMLAALGPHTEDLFPAVAGYGLILAGTAATSARCHPVVAVGGAFFLASDSILAFRLFLPASMPDWTSPAVMATYTIGQGLIVWGVLRTLAKRESR